MPAQLTSLAIEVAHSAGELLLKYFREPMRGVSAKSTPTDLVSDADREAESLIIDAIISSRPEDGIVSEEGSGRGSESGVSWVIDPLDGTINFLYGLPQWGVSIAIREGAETVAGVIFSPVVGETFVAEQGAGARLNDEPLRVSDRTDMSKALIGTGFAYGARARAEQAERLTRLLPGVRDIRRAGSAALDLSSLACGRLDGFYEAPMEDWDKAAGILIIEEAGGIVSELPAPMGLSPGVIAANPTLHPQLVELVMGGA